MAGLLTPALRQSLTVYPDKIFVEVNFGSFDTPTAKAREILVLARLALAD